MITDRRERGLRPNDSQSQSRNVRDITRARSNLLMEGNVAGGGITAANMHLFRHPFGGFSSFSWLVLTERMNSHTTARE
jgi:hypothetical protein